MKMTLGVRKAALFCFWAEKCPDLNPVGAPLPHRRHQISAATGRWLWFDEWLAG